MTQESQSHIVEVNEMLTDLASDIVSLMIREHQNIHMELEHVSNLIGDASKSLTANFDSLNTVAVKQNSLLENNYNRQTETSSILLKQLKKNQLKIVTALQFDDIVQQLTKHSQSRTRHIQMMFKKLENYISIIKESGCKITPEFNAGIIELKKDVIDLRRELEKENPVKQSSLSIGKMELF